MEVVAAVSSIAGIVALAGQVLSGIVALQGVFDTYIQASRTIEKFVSALKSLLDTIQEVKDLVQKLERASTFIAKSILLSLQTQLEDCSQDVLQWAQVARANRVGKTGSSFDTVFKKFLVALKKDSIDTIFKEIAAHQDSISIKLSVIGRHLNIQHTAHLKTIESKIVESSASHQITADALQRLESQLSGDDTDGSPCPSLRTLADQISDIHSLLRSQSSAGSAPSVSGASITGNRKGSGLFPSHILSGRPSAVSNASPVASRRTSQFGNSSHLPVRRKSSLSLNQIDSQIMPSRSRISFQTLASPIAEHPRIPALSVNSARTSLQGSHIGPLPSPRHSFDALQSSKKLLAAANGVCPDSLVAYMDLIRISETISLHTKLLTCIRRFQGHDSLDIMETKEYQDVDLKLQSMRDELGIARQRCWMEGLDMADIDKVLSSSYAQDLPRPDDAEYEQHEGTKAATTTTILQRRLEKLNKSEQQQRLRPQITTTKPDRTNAWLLHTLAASHEAVTLARSCLPSHLLSLNERQWARLVLKTWTDDDNNNDDEDDDDDEDAATTATSPASQKRPASTNAALRDGECHSVRVDLSETQTPAQKDWESLTTSESGSGSGDVEVEEGERCFEIRPERSPGCEWKRGRGTLWKKQRHAAAVTTITVTEVTEVVEVPA